MNTYNVGDKVYCPHTGQGTVIETDGEFVMIKPDNKNIETKRINMEVYRIYKISELGKLL